MVDQIIVDAMERLQAGDCRTSQAMCRGRLAEDPGSSQALQLLGVIARQAGQAEEAIRQFARVATLIPLATAWAALGGALLDRGRRLEARRPLRRALAFAPADTMQLAAMAEAEGKVGTAELHLLRRAQATDPANPAVLGNLGVALRERAQLGPALAATRAALSLGPALAEVLVSLAVVAMKQRRHGLAEGWTRRALAIHPGLPEARWNRALAQLSAGRLEAAWEDFEARWQLAGGPVTRHAPHRRWRGQDARGRILLLHAEQGLGDTIQFCRYAPLLATRGARVVLAASAPLARLLRTAAGVERVVVGDGVEEAHDWHCPLMSLPGVLGTTRQTIPASIPYLSAEPTPKAPWRPALARPAALRVGLCWQGNPAQRDDRERSLPLSALAPLLAIEDVLYVALRKEGEAIPEALPILDAAPWLQDLADTAALMEELDLVISCDSAVAHLAGALGRPTWTLLAYAADWRWGVDDILTPWYPSMRLLRQHRPGDWSRPIAQVARTLAQRRTFRSAMAARPPR